MNGIRAGNTQRNQRVATFMVGGELLLFVGHRERAALGAHHDLVLGVFKFRARHQSLAAPGRQQCGFIDKICEIGA